MNKYYFSAAGEGIRLQFLDVSAEYYPCRCCGTPGYGIGSCHVLSIRSQGGIQVK